MEPPLCIISIEGGIGVGKSTVMAHLRRALPGLAYIDEPVDTWEATGLLDAMYNGTIPPGTFQIAALATRVAPLLRAVREGHRVIVTERCPWSDFEVFTKANLDEGSVELAAYKMAYDALMSAVPSPVHLYSVCLVADVDTLLKRMEARNRAAERAEGAGLADRRRSYLCRLQKRHDAFAKLSAKELGVTKYVSSSINAGSTCSTEQVMRLAELAVACIVSDARVHEDTAEARG